MITCKKTYDKMRKDMLQVCSCSTQVEALAARTVGKRFSSAEHFALL